MVDRLGVQVQQCIQLTSTNITSAFKMIFYFCYLFLIVLHDSLYSFQFGDASSRDTPGHIPNPAVKSVHA